MELRGSLSRIIFILHGILSLLIFSFSKDAFAFQESSPNTLTAKSISQDLSNQEFLKINGENEINLIDLFYDGHLIGGFLARYDDNFIEFLKPKEIIDLLPDLKDRKAIEKILQGKMETHKNLVCQNEETSECNHLTPAIAGVIFDRNEFKAILFINPNYRRKSKISHSFLESSNSPFSLADEISANFIGSGSFQSSTNNNSYNFINKVTFGHKNFSILCQVSGAREITGDQQDITLDSLEGRLFVNYHLLKFGITNEENDFFLGNQELLGISWSRTLETFLNIESFYSSPLEVFLSRPSTVSIYKDGRLLKSGFYPAGNQVLDSKNLPYGGYNLIIKIQDNSGHIKEEQRYFLKTYQIPPRGFSLYSFAIGLPRSSNPTSIRWYPTFQKELYLLIKGEKRLRDHLGIEGGLTTIGKRLFLSGNLTIFNGNLIVVPGILFGLNGEYGFSLENQYQHGNLFLNCFLRSLWQDETAQLDPSSPLGNSRLQFQGTLTTNYQIRNLNLSFQLSGTKNDTNPFTYSFGPTVHLAINLPGQARGDLSSSIQKSEKEFLCSLNFIIAIDGENWNSQTLGGYEHLGSDDNQNPDASGYQGLDLETSLEYHKELANRSFLDFALQGGRRSDGTIPIDARGSYRNRAGQIDAEGQVYYQDGKWMNYQFLGNVRTNIIYSNHHLAFGQLGSQSGILATISGSKSSNDRFKIFANNREITIIHSGKTELIPLPPYKSYKIQIESLAETNLFHYSREPKRVILYYGNYYSLDWKLFPKHIFFCQVFSSEQKPLSNWLVNSGTVEFAMTDSSGYLQAELLGGTRRIELEDQNGQTCFLDLSQVKFTKPFLDGGKLICHTLLPSSPQNDK